MMNFVCQNRSILSCYYLTPIKSIQLQHDTLYINNHIPILREYLKAIINNFLNSWIFNIF